MLLIECPWCGPRAESEFSCGGEADIARPLETEKLSDREWGDYLFMRTNTRGEHREQWIHAQGCRRWFKIERDTVTYDIKGYETFGEPGANAPLQAPQGTPQAAPQVRGKK
ncbi:sarcosine oxidase subunit delta [Cupriavidus lacunae]|uniref:sarcosine oxidase subunit delta n=1 Tax=Cupriavidus lacunae TaxID=2666307 RepID=UPI001FC9DD1B|nr:sarcosine oxidase subunit delta [Cupriavidus lacunae]